MEHKKCARCGMIKSVTEFYKTHQLSSGYSSYCKECCCKISRNQRNPNRFDAPPMLVENSKVCPRCKNEKPLSEFSPRKRKDAPNGLSSWCKECNRVSRDGDSKSVYASNFRAKKKAAVGTVTVDDWKQIKHDCNYTCHRCKRSEPEIQLTIDHVIPLAKGGTNYPSNIQALCRSCNCAKRGNTNDYREIIHIAPTY